jgi:peptidoglycan/xylan/chitin deacetylase (PgdA/CDA1 family)
MPLQPPRLLEWIFPHIIWRGPGNDNCVYLTFDDGPHRDITPQVLDILSQHQAPASFFLVGSRITGSEKVVEQILEHGHIIANHGYSHRKLGWLSSRAIEKEITDTEAIFQSNHWLYVRHFRPPFGHFRPGLDLLLRRMGYRMVMWSLMPGDYRPMDPERLLSRAISKLTPGTIIALHDHTIAPKSLLEMLPKLLQEITLRGYRCERLDQMAGIELIKGYR